MAKLNLRNEGDVIGRRQLPMKDDNLLPEMLLDLNSKGLVIDGPQIRGKELEEFTRKFNLFTPEELQQALLIKSSDFLSVLNQVVQCVGCRRRVERLFYQLTLSGDPTLDPLVFRNGYNITLCSEKLKTPQTLGSVLHRHHEVLNNVIENKARNKTRCMLHSMDAFRAKPFSETWREIWSAMKANCRDEMAIIETKELHETLENYLKKHKFCQGCRTKIEKAYKILVGEITTKEKGFVVGLYAPIKKCMHDKHIHVVTNKIDFLDNLMRRAEPEVNGTYTKQRERHAKTLEIAQEEVLTCVGMIMYERLRRINVTFREDERACQVLAAVGIHALSRSFNTAVEEKQGCSNLELLFEQLKKSEIAEYIKRENKKLKKKKKKNEKKNSTLISENLEETTMMLSDDEEEHEELEELSQMVAEISDIETDNKENCDPGQEEEIPCNGNEEVFEPAKPAKKKKCQKQKNKKKQPPPTKKQAKKKQENTIKKDAHNCSGDDITAVSPTPTNASSGVGESLENCKECLDPAVVCPCENDVKDSGYGDSRTSSRSTSPYDTEGTSTDVDDHNGAGNTPTQQDSTCDCTASKVRDHNYFKHQLSLEKMLQVSEQQNEGFPYYIPEDVILRHQDNAAEYRKRGLALRCKIRDNFERFIKIGKWVPVYKKSLIN